MGLTATDIISDYGDYYVDEGQNAQRMRRLLYHGFESADFFRPIPTDDSVYRMANSELSEILQPFQKGWTPKGDTTFTPAPIETYKMKIDVSEQPDDIDRTWLGFLTSNNLDRAQWPLIRWWIEEHVIGRQNEDLELEAVYSGEYAAPTPGTAGDASTAMTGFKKIINDAVDNGDIPSGNVINTGSFTTSNAQTFVEEIIDFCKEVNTRYRRRVPMKMALGDEYQMLWLQGIFEKFNVNYMSMPEGNDNRVPFARNIRISFLPSMGSSQKIILTPENNAVMPVRGMENIGRFKVESEKRVVNAFTDYALGVGFPLFKAVWTNDQDQTAS
jgi:hypothetical protein